jgi:YbgC/YbaW family acyl-CoA thioester hydrolase
MALSVTTPIQMRFEDIDSFGHVNNIAQQSYFDLGKSDFFQRLWQTVGESDATPVMMVSVQTDFLRQIRYGEKVEVSTHIESIGTKSVTLQQQILLCGEVCSRSRVVMVCYDKERGASVEVPDSWRKVVE